MTSVGTVVSYPIPAYSNVPIESKFYQPSRFVISAISLGLTTIVSTTAAMNYVVGQLVRLIIPPSFGSIQLNEAKGYVLSIPTSTQVVLSINSSMNVDAYIASSSLVESAQILAIGDVNTGTTNTSGRTNTGTYIPGSFINISPL
jgi:hypothetical protein